MKITQISIFLENKSGRLCEVAELLGKNNINIRALTIADAKDFGVLRIVVDKPREAVDLLKKHKMVATLTEIVVIEVGDQPGGLAGVLRLLEDNHINVEYMYGFVEKFSDKALMVFRFDNPDEAIKLLQKNKFKVIKKEEIKSL